MILTFTPNPCVDKTVFIDRLEIGQFMRAPRYTCITGGKGVNVSRTVKTLGGPTRAMLIVGGHTGAHCIEMIEKGDGMQALPVWVESPTRTITTVLETTIHRQTAFFEPGSRVTAGEMEDVKTVFAQAIKDVKIVTLNGTVPDPAIKTLHTELLQLAARAGIMTILDAHGPEFSLALEAAPYMVKPNVAEAAEALGFPIETSADRLRALDAFHEKGVALVVLSLGKEGALVSNGKQRFHVIPPQIEEVNPVGSGDALVGGIAVGLLNGLSLEETAILGIAAGTVNAMSWDIGHYKAEDVQAMKSRIKVEKI